MNKWILVLLSFISTYAYAGEAYTQSKCASIKKERESIRSEFRQGYSVKKGERLTARDKVLFSQLAKHCNKLRKSNHSYRPHASRSVNTKWLLNQKVSNMTLHSASYKNKAKLEAWSKFYKLPKQCRKKEMETSDFVWCSEYRVAQKQVFETQWQGRP
ncbi:hypothetical protein [Pseudoalteromonas sp. C12FD-1]|uniref:hypothetical protein n=1 Tax=Pseudoalteromonas sp. C12FD-1 TaxID=3131979 RepID=UPI00307F5881